MALDTNAFDIVEETPNRSFIERLYHYSVTFLPFFLLFWVAVNIGVWNLPLFVRISVFIFPLLLTIGHLIIVSRFFHANLNRAYNKRLTIHHKGISFMDADNQIHDIPYSQIRSLNLILPVHKGRLSKWLRHVEIYTLDFKTYTNTHIIRFYVHSEEDILSLTEICSHWDTINLPFQAYKEENGVQIAL